MSTACGDGGERRLVQLGDPTIGDCSARHGGSVYQIVHAVGLPNAYKLVTVLARAKHRRIKQGFAFLCDLVASPLVTVCIGIFANCQMGDKLLVGASPLCERSTFCLKARGDTGTNGEEGLRDPQDVQLLRARGHQGGRAQHRRRCGQEVCKTRKCRLAVVAHVFLRRTRLRRRPPRSRECSHELVLQECFTMQRFFRPRSFKTQAVARDFSQVPR